MNTTRRWSAKATLFTMFILVTGCFLVCVRPGWGNPSDKEPVKIGPGTKIESPGTYATSEMTLRLICDMEWTVQVFKDNKLLFSDFDGSNNSRWFCFIASPREVWFYSGDIGDRRLELHDDGSVTFEGFPVKKDVEGRRAFADAIPDGFWNLLTETTKRAYRPYLSRPKGEKRARPKVVERSGLESFLTFIRTASGVPSHRDPVEVATGAKIGTPGTYVTSAMALRLIRDSRQTDAGWTVEVLKDDKLIFSQTPGRWSSEWFAYIASPRTVWFYDGAGGIEHLELHDNGSVTFEALPPAKDEAARRAYIDSMPDAFWVLLPERIKQRHRSYRSEPKD